MNKIFILTIFIALSFLSKSEARQPKIKEQNLCNGIIIKGRGIPVFSDVERILICGDSKTDDAVGDSWRHVPRSQSKFHLGVFLENRGYYNAVYTDIGDRYAVDIGEPTRVTKVIGQGVPGELQLWRKRRIVKQILTPALLNELEKWTITRLQALGYGCPSVTSHADVNTGEVTVIVVAGKKQNLIKVEETKLESLRTNVLDRYSAFRVGEIYNGDLITISERRMVKSGVLQGVNFTTTCTPEGITVKRSGIQGPPRLIRVGVGTNTEGLLLLRASYTNTKVGDHASLFDVNFYGSTQTQSLNAAMDWYNLGTFSRNFLHPAAQIVRQSEDPFETNTVRSMFHIGSTYDHNNVGFRMTFGPTIEYISTIVGYGPQEAYLTSLELNTSFMSHDYEYYIKSPRSGYKFNFKANLNSNDFQSTVEAQRLNADWEYLYNFKDYDVPYWTLGIRGAAGTIFSDERPGPGTKLPPNLLNYLGGSSNMRGFSRLGITQQGTGGMSMGYLGLEARSVDNRIPYNINPFIFFDMGALGNDPMTLDFPYYYSPGIGLRWESPVGTVRGTVAQGIKEGDPNRVVQFYFSFGEEF